MEGALCYKLLRSKCVSGLRMGDTPQTVMTTRAPAVLIKCFFLIFLICKKILLFEKSKCDGNKKNFREAQPSSSH